MSDQVRIAILGASGYTGAELVRLLVRHPRVRIVALTADRRAGQSLDTVFPHLGGLALPTLVAIPAVDWSEVDACFCALPHGNTQSVIAGLPSTMKVVDLSADFRLADPLVYEHWYGQAHRAVSLQKQVVYGLTEIQREAIKTARIVANPGCYPTASQLPLIPLLEQGLIQASDIVIDAKSGVSGAGRTAKEANLFTEVAEGIHPYGIGGHRHAPEIEQGLSAASGRAVTVTFTPHLMPMSRGILASMYVKVAETVTAKALHAALAERYAPEPFVRVLPFGQAPQTRFVRGSNVCLVGVCEDRAPGRALVFGAIDNLVKGASGQAIQNMNVMLGYPETLGLEQQPLFP